MKVFRAPFPYFGGKAIAAELIWNRFGFDVKNYCEPFFGSGAVLLNKPPEVRLKASVANDIDGYVCNFWRATQADPAGVARHAGDPINEIDIQSRHQWLVNQRDTLTEKLISDPEYYCSKSAGWWAWGCCAWIGSGWCKDPAGKQVKRQLPFLGDAGQGVNRQLPHLGNAGQGLDRHETRTQFVSDWMKQIREVIQETRFACGNWERICTPNTLTRFGKCAVLLDPPYGTTEAVYAFDSSDIASEVHSWCLANGDNKNLAIALCGHEFQHEALEKVRWDCQAWAKRGGYQGADERERIWFSPHCVPAINRSTQLSLLDLTKNC